MYRRWITLPVIRPLPVSHCVPVHPASHVQVSGDEQVPPFWQGLLQVAAVGENTTSSYPCAIKENLEVNHAHAPATPLITYECTEVHSHSIVHWTGRFYCLIPAVCSLHHRCRSLQSCRLYWRDCVDHLWEYQDHHSWWLESVNKRTKSTKEFEGHTLRLYGLLKVTCIVSWLVTIAIETIRSSIHVSVLE